MGLNLQIVALTLPDGSEFPGTPQGLMDSNAQYLAIEGEENFSGINHGDVEPSADNRDRPWFKTDSGGNPIGWFSWNGTLWAPSPVEIQSGTTLERPVSPGVGRQFFDTDISVQIVWDGTRWTMVSGSPGDTKEVYAADLSTALTKNPGWEHDTDSIGMVIAGASDGSGSGYDYDTDAGADSVMLIDSDLPDVQVPLPSGWYPYSGQHQNGSQPAGVYPIVTGQSNTSETQSMNSGTQTGVDVRQPTKYLWRLVQM
jgi:hypothetical protein